MYMKHVHCECYDTVAVGTHVPVHAHACQHMSACTCNCGSEVIEGSEYRNEELWVSHCGVDKQGFVHSLTLLKDASVLKLDCM